ncbi:hypothetical protein PhCBS80983_g06173 [Powellomyces hirtus]|uniref:Reverse transcriptase domain-containing protein n=1 Tax=Powellomyces hirtus TaxID=109895 RepID=A0A507DPU9_9FUNG|nr:hypothetical protein PhCBS80983_g06173 [Powellomyces hirtus]
MGTEPIIALLDAGCKTIVLQDRVAEEQKLEKRPLNKLYDIDTAGASQTIRITSLTTQLIRIFNDASQNYDHVASFHFEIAPIGIPLILGLPFFEAIEDCEKTAIRTRFRLFEYVVMLFGLCNAPGTFQRLMNQVLGNLYDICSISYLDDILIVLPNPDKHHQDVAEVLQRLQDHSLYVNAAKCHWGQCEIEFCGLFNINGMRIADNKIAAIRDWPTPWTTQHIWQFLELTNYFLDYIERYAEIAAPSSALQGINSACEWTVKEQKAFNSLKAAVTSTPVLATFNPNHPIYVHTDSSSYAILGWLGQTANGESFPIPLPIHRV